MPPTSRRSNKRARTNSTTEPLIQAPPPPPIETPGESSITKINETSSVPGEETNNLPSAHTNVMESIAERNFIFQQPPSPFFFSALVLRNNNHLFHSIQMFRHCHHYQDQR